MNERLESILDPLDLAIIRPQLSLKTEACFDLDLVLVIQEHHALSDVAACLLKPFLCGLVDMDQNRAHLASSNGKDGHPVAMNALDLDDREGALEVWPQQHSLILPKDSLVHDALEDVDSDVFIVALLGVGLGVMELAPKRLLLLIRLRVLVLEGVKEALEEGDALLGQVAHLEDRTHDLALHLPVDQNYVLFVLNNVSDLAADLPNLRAELVHNVLEDAWFLDEVDLGQNDDHWDLKGKGDAEVVKDALFELHVVFVALVGVNDNQGVVRVVCAETSDHFLGISFMASNVDEVDDL